MELVPCCDVWAGGTVGGEAFACVFEVGFVVVGLVISCRCLVLVSLFLSEVFLW